MNEKEQEEFVALRNDLGIQLDSLHICAMHQPDLVLRAGELAAELKAKARRKRLEVSELEAETERDAREDPEQYGISKITEGAIKSAVAVFEGVRNLRRDAVAADEDSDRAAVLAEAYRHRKSMLQEEVSLYQSNYWGDVEATESKEMAGQIKTDEVEKRRKKKRKEKEDE